MRLLGGIRLSDLTDESTSPERQKASITGFTRREDTIVGWAVDLDVSGSISPFQRKELGPWLTDPKLIDQWDAIIVAKFDRLTRSLFDFIELWRWCDAHGKSIISVQERFDFSTPQGRAFIQMLAVFAEFERGMIAERVKQAYTALRAAGQYAGGAQVPFGYMPVKLQPKGWGFALDPVYAPILHMMVQKFLGGWSLSRIAGYLNGEGIPTSRNVLRRRGGELAVRDGKIPKPEDKDAKWSAATVKHVLSSPAITGVMTMADGKILRNTDGMAIKRAGAVKDTFAPPLVDQETFLRIQKQLKVIANKTGPRENSSPLLRVAFCGRCGTVIYTSRVTVRGKLYSYYECGDSVARKGKCREKKIRAGLLEEALEEVLLEAVGDLPMRRKIIHPGTDNSAEMKQIEEAIASLEDSFVGSGMSADRYAKTMARLEARQAALSGAETDPERTEWVETGQTFREHWGGLEDRNAFLRDAGVKIRVHHTAEEEDVWPMPDPDGRVVRLAGNGLWVEVHLGDVADLRELAAAQA